MARIDLEPLFTNFPINKTIKNTVDDLLSNNMYLGKLSKSELHYLLKLATSESIFIFGNISHKQIDGVSMASPLNSTCDKIWVFIWPSRSESLNVRFLDTFACLRLSNIRLKLHTWSITIIERSLKILFRSPIDCTICWISFSRCLTISVLSSSCWTWAVVKPYSEKDRVTLWLLVHKQKYKQRSCSCT